MGIDTVLSSQACVTLQEIDWSDRTFEIPSFTSANGLHESLTRCGLLHPPWVLRAESGRLVVVDGFKRLEWLRDTGARSGPCVLLPPRTPRDTVWVWRISGKAFGPSLNSAEKALLVARLLALELSESDRRLLLGHLEIALRPEVLGRWRVLGESGTGLLRAVALGEICERAALELATWHQEQDGRDSLLQVIRQLRCSASIQMELIDRVSEIASAREGGTRLALLGDPEIVGILEHSRWNRREKTQALRDLLTRWRFPRLCAREESFQKQLLTLELPKGAQIQHPPLFEGGGLWLRVDFSSPEELTRRLEAVLAIAGGPAVEALLQPVRRRES